MVAFGPPMAGGVGPAPHGPGAPGAKGFRPTAADYEQVARLRQASSWMQSALLRLQAYSHEVDRLNAEIVVLKEDVESLKSDYDDLGTGGGVDSVEAD